MGIEPKKVKKGVVQYYVYEATSDYLLEQYKKNSWMDDSTDKISTKHELPCVFNDKNIDLGVDTSDQSVDVISNYKLKIKDMEEHHKRELDLMKMQLTCKELTETSKQLKLIVDILTQKNHIKKQNKEPKQDEPKNESTIKLKSETESNQLFMNVTFEHALGYEKREYTHQYITDLIDIGINVLSKELGVNNNI